MEIINPEFKGYLKRNLICRFLGHNPSKWMVEWWAFAHSTGYDLKVCERCGIRLGKRKSRFNPSDLNNKFILTNKE